MFMWLSTGLVNLLDNNICYYLSSSFLPCARLGLPGEGYLMQERNLKGQIKFYNIKAALHWVLPLCQEFKETLYVVFLFLNRIYWDDIG